MKKLIWKIKYAIEMRRVAKLPCLVSWDFAGSFLEMTDGDLDECDPVEAVETEISYWDAE